MSSKSSKLILVLVVVVLIVAVDVLFFRNLFWERLLSNIGIVAVFAAVYAIFLRNR